MASVWETAKAYDPFAFAKESMEPQKSMIAPFLPIIGGAVQAIPSIVGLFQKPEAPKSTYDPTAYSRDLQAAIAQKTQTAIAAQQTQALQQHAKAQVEVEQIKAQSTQRMLLYGGGALVVGIGLIVLVSTMRKKEN